MHRYYYGWTIVGVSFVTLALSFGVWYSFSVFFVAIINEFGWSRAATAGVFSLFMLVHSGVAVIIGAFIDRYGPRKVMPAGSMLIVIGLLAASRTQSLTHLYLSLGVITGVGICCIGYVANSICLPNWFHRKRGLAIGIAMAGIGVGMQVMVPLTQLVISKHGWRIAYFVLAMIILGIVMPLNAFFQRRNPEEVGQRIDGLGTAETPEINLGGTSDPTNSEPSSVMNWTLKNTMFTRRFWFLFLTLFFTPLAIQGTFLHQVAHVVDSGFSAEKGALFFGLAGIMGSVGKILFGYLSDRIGREKAFAMGMGCAFMGVLALMALHADRGSLLLVYAILFGLGYGSVAPSFPARAADLFQGAQFGRIFGFLSIAGGLGGATGTWLSGKIFDVTQSYTIAFLIALSALVCSALSFWFTSPPRAEKE